MIKINNKPKSIRIDDQAATLIGFALKSRQTVSGLEAVRRAIEREKIEFVLVESSISTNSLRKLEGILSRHQIRFYQTRQSCNWSKLWGLDRHKILGIAKGKLGRSILQKYNSGV